MLQKQMARDPELSGGLSTLGLSLGIDDQTAKRVGRSTVYNQGHSNSLLEPPPTQVSPIVLIEIAR